MYVNGGYIIFKILFYLLDLIIIGAGRGGAGTRRGGLGFNILLPAGRAGRVLCGFFVRRGGVG